MSISPTKYNRSKQLRTPLDDRSLKLRRTIVHMLETNGRGHLGSAFSLVEILRVLYDDILIYDPETPNWKGRDRFILSKGQGCLALYAILAEKGFFPESELWICGKSEGILGGHPEIHIPGVEASTGSLGHGLSIGIGFALNARHTKSKSRSFVVIGDGESNEGSIWEAALCAGKHKLSNLTVIIDYNQQQSYSYTNEVQELEPYLQKWESFGFSAIEIDGHNVSDIRNTLATLPLSENKPSAVICHTIKGKGIDFVEQNLEWHHKTRVTETEIEALMGQLGGK